MKRISEIVICIAVVAGCAYGIVFVHSFVTDNLSMGYDFSTFKGGPQIGDVIPIDSLDNKDGKKISEIYDGKLILLGIVDPGCGACKVARDQIFWINENIQANDISYAFVSFTFTGSKVEFFRYSNSFGFKADSFQWTGSDPPPTSLRRFVVPSHLLIDSKGKILGKFPGTNADIKIRERIAKQITKEVLQMKESLYSQ